MGDSIVLGLIQNIAILLSFTMLHDYFWSREEKMKSLNYKLFTGIVLGGIGLVLMLTPWTFIPGIVFDTRSVMLSVAGLFFGFVPTLIAMIITGGYRLFLGGGGALMGVAVILSSGFIGIFWWHFRPQWSSKKPWAELALMGILVHMVMFCCTILLPPEIRWKTLSNIALPVITIYPTASVLLGVFMLKQAENWESRKALRISEERWQFALEGSGDGVWDWNPATKEVFFSKQWKKMLGYDDHELENKLEEWDKRIHPDQKAFVYEQLKQHTSGLSPYYISEYQMLCKDGTYKWILDRGKIMNRDAKGNPIRFIGTHTDVSELKNAQENITKLNDELELKVIDRTRELEQRSQDLLDSEGALLNLVEDLNERTEQLHQSTLQLQAVNYDLEAFAYSVSHDLRAPIRHIDGFSKLLRKSMVQSTPETERYLNKINESASKMSVMIEDLLSFSRLGRKAIQKTEVDLNLLVAKAIDHFKIETQTRKINWLVSELPTVQGDFNLLLMVFENLISNALKFTSNRDEALIEIGSCENNEECSLFIRDNGVGFDMAYVNKLFGVFQRLHTENEFEGTGIGLANVKQIIQKHGATISAQGEIDKGATFLIKFI